VSIVIPTYNRGVRVRDAVQKCRALRPAPREILIVDDHSDDGSEQELRALAVDTVKYIRLPENQGQASARSIGFASAPGTYLVSLDDDSWLLDTDALQQIWRRLDQLPRCGLLALRGFSPGLPIEPACDRLMMVADHITCGAAYRADVLHRIGYHLPFLRYEGEEADISLKMIAAGYDIVQDDSIRFFHDYDPDRRSTKTLRRVRRFAVRNDLLRCWIYFPLDMALGLSLWRFLSHFLWGVRTHMIGTTFAGYLDAVRLWPAALRVRQPIGRRAATRYLKLRRRPQPLAHA
jgi:glycosyltransferase involved in cell wall biosynthesis